MQTLIEALAEGELAPDPDNPDFVIHAYVVVEDDDFSAIEAAGFDIASSIGNSAVVTLELGAVESLAALPGIVGIFAPPVGTAHDGPAVSTTWDQAGPIQPLPRRALPPGHHRRGHRQPRRRSTCRRSCASSRAVPTPPVSG